MRDMIKDSALVLAEKIRCGEIKIVEVLDAVYESEKQNKELNCFITLCRERAYSKGSEIQKRINAGEYISPLAGVPIGIKDNIAVENVKMACGSHMLENYVPPVSAAAVEKLEEAGLIIVGKLNMDEFAMGSTGETSYYGAVLNPIDKTRVPGGSSSGAAAAGGGDSPVRAPLGHGRLGQTARGVLRGIRLQADLRHRLPKRACRLCLVV